MSYKSGMGLQDRLKAYLDSQRYDVEVDETLDHKFKLDFAIRKFPQNPRFYSLGLQVTERCDDQQKLRIFFEVQTSGFQVVDRAMYIEIEAGDFEHGVGHLVSTAISSFQFDRRFADEKCIGVRVLASMRLQFFDIKERLQALSAAEIKLNGTADIANKMSAETPIRSTQEVAPKQTAEVVPPALDLRRIGEELSGRLKHKEEISAPNSAEILGFINGFYRARGEGFISGQDGASYYFKLEGVSDGRLRDRLMNLPYYEAAVPVEGTVAFRTVGKTRPNAKYEEARGLRTA